MIQSKTTVKYKDQGSPTISVNIGGTCIDKALLDLGASVNLLPYSDSPPPVPPPTASAAPETAGPSSTSQQSPEHVPVSFRELSAVMDVVCALSTT